MRVSRAVVAALFVMSCGAPAGEAKAACRACDATMHCITVPLGARLCIEKPGVCAMLLECLEGPLRFPDSAEEVTVWTLFDAVQAPAPSLRAEAGSLCLGEPARAMCGSRGATAAIADVAVAYGREYSASFVTSTGDGFALRRAVEGGRVRLEVREVSGEQVGRLLASESLGERDQLTVPVHAEGRERILVLQTASIRGGSGPGEVARLRREMRGAGRALAARAQPLFEARAQ